MQSCALTSLMARASGVAPRRGAGCCRSSWPAPCSSGWSSSSSAWTPTVRRGAVAAAIVAALLAVAAVVITWLESRRITGHLNRTIDRLIEAESELRVLLDDLPEAVMSVDDHGIVRGANARAAELVGQPVEDLVGRRLDGFVESSRLDELTSWLAGGRRGEAVPPMSLRVLRAGAPTATLVEALVERPHRSAGAAIVRLRDITEREARVRPWSRPASGSSRPSTRRRRAWPSCACTTRRSSTPTVRWPRCSTARSASWSADRSATSPTPTTCALPRPTAPGSSSTAATAICSTNGSCAATASSCGRAPASR